jgi:hypothetical protein
MASQEIQVLLKIKNNLLMHLTDIESRLNHLSSDNYIYECEETNQTFTKLEEYEKYKKSNKYFKMIGKENIKCKKCNRTFYCEEHFTLHEEDGRCEKSRTFNGIIYSNMQSKSVAKKELVNIIIPGQEQDPQLFQNIKTK